MVGTVGSVSIQAATWVVAFVVVFLFVPLYPVLAHRRPSTAEAEAVRTACAEAGVDPLLVRVARGGGSGAIGVSCASLLPGRPVVSVSEALLREAPPDRIAASVAVQAGRRRLRYVAFGFGFALLWVEYGMYYAVGAAAPGAVNWATAVPLGAVFGLGPLALVGVGLWFYAFCRGVDRSIAHVGHETTLAALERGRRGADSRVTRYLYDRTIESLVDGRFGPGRDAA